MTTPLSLCWPLRRGHSRSPITPEATQPPTGRWWAAANPPWVYIVRAVLKAGGEVRDVARARTPTHGRLRDQLVGIAVMTVGVDVVCALLAFVFEHHAKQTQIKTLGSALFWTSTQLLTVSSQIQNPTSTPGRVLDVAMEAYAITVVAALAGAIGSFLVKRGRELEHDATQHARAT